MKRYKIETGQDSKGLLKVSFVDEPAIQSTLLHFAKEKLDFVFQNEEKRIIYAPALIPDLDIFRRNINGEPANVFFTAETILKLHQEGCKNGYDQKINLNHDADTDITGVYCFENWIIEDEKQDKAFKLGFELPVGTLMKGYKVDNDEVWQDIKSGKITGLSIEANLLPVEEEIIILKKEDMTKPNLILLAFEKFKELFKFADMTDYGSGFYGASLELGAIVTDKDGNPMPNAEFEYEGNKYKTDEMGAISEVEPVEDGGGEDTKVADLEAKILELETENADLKAQITKAGETQMAVETDTVKLKADFDAKDAEVLKLTSELMELKKIPAIPKEDAIPYDKMTNKQKVKFNREN
jgi:hypothetical protein